MATIKCVCGETMEAAANDALLETVRAHIETAHADWNSSEGDWEDLAEAVSRGTLWDGELRRIEGEPEIRELTPALADDFISFFDRDAFADNPMWAGCYCMFYVFGGSEEEWSKRRLAQNRADKRAAIERREAFGLLAYAGGKPVAWCNASPKTALAGIMAKDGFRGECGDEAKTGAIVCFVVSAPYRKQGVAAKLLGEACESFRARGLTVAEAYPAKESHSDARVYHGPLSMYLAAGFEQVGETGHYAVVRKALA